MTRVLAYDLGGSSLRVAVVSAGNEILQMVRTPMRIPKGHDGSYEVDPNEWWDAFVEGCQSLAGQGADLASVEAIAGCGFTRTQVPVGRNGDAVHPAITFQDFRGTRALADYLSEASDDLGQRYDGLSPFHPVARLLWLRTRTPDVWNLVEKILEPKDYINFRLTGEIASDRISQNAARSFFEAIAKDTKSQQALGFDDTVLPTAGSPFDEIGCVRRDIPGLSALAGKPVICGSTDTWGSVLGSGAMVAETAYCISGTSDVSGILATECSLCEGLLTLRWAPGLWQIGGPSQGAATRLNWAVEKLAPGRSIIDVVAESVPKTGPTPIFLPYLEGERTPYWDKSLRGAFIGLDESQGTSDLVRAVCEGINFLSRVVLERAEAAAGSPARHICFAGGLSNNPLLCQLKADVADRPVFVAKHNESGLVGAACLAGNSADRLAAISSRLMEGGTWYRPSAASRAEIDNRFEAFKQSTDALRPVMRGLQERAMQQGNIK
ncbi:xylulokinase [Oricola sp.]|uniref:xylulokinase n=1 Tax=Oricola sp. TaxID=1979950 RepID=UPI003BAC94C2